MECYHVPSGGKITRPVSDRLVAFCEYYIQFLVMWKFLTAKFVNRGTCVIMLVTLQKMYLRMVKYFVDKM